MLATCDHSFRGRRDVALMGFLLDTGWRVSEILRVAVDMVASGGRITIAGKGQKVLTTKPRPAVQQMTDRYLRVRRSEHPEL